VVMTIPNQGHCTARNIGISAHNTNVAAITVMDADDVWLPHALEALVCRLRARPDCIGAHGLGEFIDSAGQPFDTNAFSAYGRSRRSGRSGRLRDWPVDGDTTFETIVTSSTVFPPGLLLMRRSAYSSIGGYDPQSVEGDWDLLIRASRHGPLAYIDDVIILYRRHARNFGARREIRLLTHLTLVRAHESDLNSPGQATILRACWRAQQVQAMQVHRSALSTARGVREIGELRLRLVLAVGRYLRGRPRVPLRVRISSGLVGFARPGAAR
jgi:glycosyltransferase involved in cell wall biosynthesis